MFRKMDQGGGEGVSANSEAEEKQDDGVRTSGPLDTALDKSAHELQLLANFYHQHSYPERAQEIYQTILKIRRDRDKREP